MLILLILAVFIAIIIMYEVITYMCLHLKIGFNVGNLLTNKQLREILNLLENESKQYGASERRINIYTYKRQFVLIFCVRIVLAYIAQNRTLISINRDIIKENEEALVGWYCENNNFIEIYEFILRKCYGDNNIALKSNIVKIIFHEYRHKYQVNMKIMLSDEELEMDAEQFEEEFYNRNKEQIEKILFENCSIEENKDFNEKES